jgi:tRNA G18 (ribose-2'-O)-methylase SpoU
MGLKIKNEALGRLSLEEFKQADKNKIIIVLDNVRSLHNVGSVFRTADAFLIEEIFLCGVTGTPPNKEIEKTALGATDSVKWSHFKNTSESINTLKEKGYRIYAVEQAEKSISLNRFQAAGEKTALVFGNEVYGVEQDVVDACDGIIEIPQLGTKHSLNIAVSVGVVLWEMMRTKL